MVNIILITSRIGLGYALKSALDGTHYNVILACNVEHAVIGLLPMTEHVILLGDTRQSFLFATHLLRTNLQTKNIPILLHTNNFCIHNPDYVARLGVKAVLAAPLSLNHLLREVDNCLHEFVA
ncbi:MAG: hypothetical protein AAFV93_20670 [Chloroflexota bacterium]